MKKLFCLLLALLLTPVCGALAAQQPLYSAIAKISGPIYAAMDRDSATVGRISPSYAVDVYAIYPEWLAVGLGGTRGYVPRNYLAVGKPLNKESTPPWGVVFYQFVGTAGSRGADVLSAPEAGAAALAHVPADGKVSVIDLENGWARVAYYRQYGYIDSNLLSELLPVCAEAGAGTDYAPIATFTSFYVVGSDDVGVHGKEINIGVNCQDMNGRIIASGDTVDYDACFGPYLPAKNYVKGPVLLDYGWGLGPGGGVCQVSSTLYNALIQLPGINVIHHISHSSQGIAYLPLDMDAAVGNPDHAVDLIFRNEYPFDIRYEALAQEGVLFIALYRVSE